MWFLLIFALVSLKCCLLFCFSIHMVTISLRFGEHVQGCGSHLFLMFQIIHKNTNRRHCVNTYHTNIEVFVSYLSSILKFATFTKVVEAQRNQFLFFISFLFFFLEYFCIFSSPLLAEQMFKNLKKLRHQYWLIVILFLLLSLLLLFDVCLLLLLPFCAIGTRSARERTKPVYFDYKYQPIIYELPIYTCMHAHAT